METHMQSTELVEKLLTHYSVTYREAPKPPTPEQLQLQKLQFLSSVPGSPGHEDYEAFKKFLDTLKIPNKDDLKLAIEKSKQSFEFDYIKDRSKKIQQFSDMYMSALEKDGFWGFSEYIVRNPDNNIDAEYRKNLIVLTFEAIKIIMISILPKFIALNTKNDFESITQKIPEGVSDFIFHTFFPPGNPFLDEQTKSRIQPFLQLRPPPEMKKKNSSGIFSLFSGKKRKEPSSSLA